MKGQLNCDPFIACEMKIEAELRFRATCGNSKRRNDQNVPATLSKVQAKSM